MIIGEKITKLRNFMGISQEEFADELGVSRQAVSKWEMNQSLPQIDKVIQMCDIFKVSTDELLKDKISINVNKEKKGNKYYGTEYYRIPDQTDCRKCNQGSFG